MIGQELRDFIDAALDDGRLGAQDVARLVAEVLPHGVRSRAEADALAALDRLVSDRPAAWDDVFVDLLVTFVVSAAAAAGEVDRETANWLMTTLDAGGVTDNGLRVVIEVSRSVPQVDQTLMSFVLHSMQARREVVAAPAAAARAPAGADALVAA